ncbi:MAG: cyclic nucleotide-binding domain-containing protein [Elusimicrobiota bacterium]
MNKDEAKWLLESLRKIQFFSVFTLDNIDSILKHFQKITYPKGKNIINEGEPGEAFFIIHSGKVRVLRKKALFLRQQLAVLGPGDFFGEMSLVSDRPATATIAPSETAELYVLLKTDFNIVLKANPKMSEQLHRIAEERKLDAAIKSI